MSLNRIHVVVREGRAVVAFTTLFEARTWKATREAEDPSRTYTIDYVPLATNARSVQPCSFCKRETWHDGEGYCQSCQTREAATV